MIPFAFFLIVTGLGLLFEENNRKNPELYRISHRDIYTNFQMTVYKNSNSRVVRSHITRAISKLRTQYSHFKIGKTGTPDERFVSHTPYSKMFIVAVSRHKEIIEGLEKEYNDRFARQSGCDNVRGGSAGIISEVSGRYYLYIVVR